MVLQAERLKPRVDDERVGECRECEAQRYDANKSKRGERPLDNVVDKVQSVRRKNFLAKHVHVSLESVFDTSPVPRVGIFLVGCTPRLVKLTTCCPTTTPN